MGEPVVTMSRPYHVTRALRGPSQGDRGARGHGANALLDQRPRGFDRIEVVRVRRQEPEGRARVFNQVAHLPGLMRRQVVHEDDIPGAQLPHEVSSYPADEAWTIHRAPGRGKGEPLVRADGSDHRQVIAPVHRARFDQDFAARQPRVRAAHREIRARFIKEDQPTRVYLPNPAAEAPTFGLDRGPIQFCGP